MRSNTIENNNATSSKIPVAQCLLYLWWSFFTFLLVHNLGNSPAVKLKKLAPGHGEQREIGERGRTVQIGRCSFNKQRNLHMGFVYGGWKTSKFSTFACQNPKSFIEALTGFNHVCSPDGRSNTLLSQGCIFEVAPSARNRVPNVYSKDKGGV